MEKRLKKRLVVLTGAGISAESGLKTFRDNGGLWENHSIEEVATLDAFQSNPELVLAFYNKRRMAAAKASPNLAHNTLALLENHFSVNIITQNVDDLHERGGSSDVTHLHGELTKVRSTGNESLIYDIGGDEINLGDLADDGHQLRPHIVWFGEPVPIMDRAIEIVARAEIFMVIGTSLQVYPAAGLVHYVPDEVPIILIDKKRPSINLPKRVRFCEGEATKVLPRIVPELLKMA